VGAAFVLVVDARHGVPERAISLPARHKGCSVTYACPFCGYAMATPDRYGCPNCLGEGLDDHAPQAAGQAFYNDTDPYCAQWLRNLMAAGHIAPGRVVPRDVRDLQPEDIDGHEHAHFFVVCTELEDIGYAVAPVDIPAACVGAPHLRQRLYFVADTDCSGRERIGRQGQGQANGTAEHRTPCDVADPERARSQARAAEDVSGTRRRGEGGQPRQSGEFGGRAWADAEWIACRDGKARPTQSGVFPLAHGLPNRVGRLRAYGNAIVPQVAAAVIRAYMERE